MTYHITSPGISHENFDRTTLLIGIATRNVVRLAPGDSVGEAARIMAAKRISSIVVTDNDGHPSGIVTERNMLNAMQSGCLPGTALQEVMSTPVITVPESITCLDAYQICLHDGIRHLVIVDDDKLLLGVVSETDFRLHINLTALAGRRQVASVMGRSVSSLSPEAGLRDALNLMQSHRDSCVVVVEAERPVGIITERDIVRLYSGNSERIDIPVKEVMTFPVLTISLDNTINEAAERMLAAKVRHLVVVDRTGRMAGLISEHDLSHNMALSLIDDKLVAEGAFLHTLMNTIPDLVWLKDVNGVYRTCNQRFERYFGAKEKDIAGKTDYDFVDKELADSFRERDRKAMANSGPSVNEEWVTFADDGHRELLETIMMPMSDVSGKQIGVLSIARDITGRKRLEQQLAEREEVFHAIFDQAPNGVELIDPETLRFVEANPAACRMLGYTHEEYLQLRLTDTQVDLNEEALIASLRELEASDGTTFENRHLCKNGDILDVEINARMLNLPGKRLLVGVWHDITGRKRAEESLRITASVFDNSQEAILITDANNAIMDVNPAFTRITGYSREEVLGRNPKLLSSGRQDKAFYAAMMQSLEQKKAWRGEIWNLRKSGEIYAEMLSISAICGDDGDVLYHVGVFSDISHLKEHEAELRRVAHYDALTGIPNRVLLADRMRHAIAQTAREQNMVAICYLDLDGFKSINDTMGHDAGDQVLIEVARRIGNAIRGGDTVSRLGGDEFVVVLMGLEKGEECVVTLERLLATIAQPITIKDTPLTLSASIGVSLYPLDDEDPDTLLRHADQAMYVAKQSGKNRFCIYDHALDMRTRNHHEFLKSIHCGLGSGQFELHYQPKINLRTRQLVGAEALIRWRNPERGLLFPAEFLRSIENTELDIEIGDWVIATALAHINRWRHAGLDIKVSVNISAHHLESPRFVERLRQQLSQYPDMPPCSLQIEVLETAALNDIVVVRGIIETCQKFGVGFALDDFGTGSSSLSCLSRLPVDVLKIDQSFVRDMLGDKGNLSIVQGIIALARAFNLQTVAEGIETGEHYQTLLNMDCEIGQGYYIAQPMRANELASWRAG